MYYLPSELTHYTTNLYYGSLLTHYNPSILSDSVEINISDLIGLSSDNFNSRYYQDPYVQLYNASKNNYLNLFNSALINIIGYRTVCASDICEYEPRYTSPNPSDPNLIKTYTLNKVIDVPFTYKLKSGTTRRVEYYSGPATLANDTNIQISVNDPTEEDMLNNLNIREQSKGGNFISAPFGTDLTKSYIFTVNGAKPELLEKIRSYPLCDLTELNCSFKSNGFRHIDELMCFMPYGKTESKLKIFKVWFYDELDTNSFNNLIINNSILNIRNKSFRSLDTETKRQYLELLNTERIANLNLISYKLFGSDYASNTDKFVFFKLYLNSASIFNRVWIEKPDLTICLFGQNSLSDIVVENVNRVNIECANLKSWINQTSPAKPILFKWLNVPLSNENYPEGGLHCMIKQRFGMVISE